MSGSPTPIAWVQTTADMGYLHEEGTTPEGTFCLDHPGEDGLVRVAFQWPMPQGVAIDEQLAALKAARAAAEPGSPDYWRAARTYPSTGPEQGYFASHAMAHALIEAAAARECISTIDEILAQAGFRTTALGSWERRAACGRLCLIVHDQVVHLRFERRGARCWDNLLRLGLAWRGHAVMVHAAWPSFMASLSALVRIAVDAADYSDAQGLTGPKRARRHAA